MLKETLVTVNPNVPNGKEKDDIQMQAQGIKKLFLACKRIQLEGLLEWVLIGKQRAVQMALSALTITKGVTSSFR